LPSVKLRRYLSNLVSCIEFSRIYIEIDMSFYIGSCGKIDESYKPLFFAKVRLI